ncbi:50S ribosomal protein L15 [Sphingobacteriales bacterium UPWRP_1]|nr:50S ribosomal protein L15 [Sphingobacteriales bacterium UPWRP_1]
MTLSNLKPAAGSVHKEKRIGRGQGSGHGGTSTRGHKGGQSRSGYSRKRNFEGGQTPIQMRVPKRGFKNINRISYTVIDLAALEALANKHGLSDIDYTTLRKLRIVNREDRVKILANGELMRPLHVSVHAFSAAAKRAIEEKGGTATVVE